jgi:Kef-type K+ transport system membrane component KefB
MFVSIFFVVSGVQFDLAALIANASAITMVPPFLVGLVLVRGLPTLLYRHRVGTPADEAPATGSADRVGDEEASNGHSPVTPSTGRPGAR